MPDLSRRQFIISAAMALALPMAARAEAGRGVILVGASWCEFCERASNALYVATRQWGWPVLIASADDRPIGPFEHFVSAVGHPIATHVRRYPTTLIVHPSETRVLVAFEGFKGMRPYLARIQRGLETGEGGDV